MGYPLLDDVSQRWAYLIKKAKITDVASDAASLIQSQEKTRYTSQITHAITYDTRDSKIEPSDGYKATLETDLAGIGGSIYHLRNTAKAGYYYPISDDLKFSVA